MPVHPACIRGSFVVADSTGVQHYTPTVMTGEGKEQTHKAMRLMLERGAPMLVTNPGTCAPHCCDLRVAGCHTNQAQNARL